MTTHPDFQELIENTSPRDIVLLHHWDADGLGCAALFMDYLATVAPQAKVHLINPSINNYFMMPAEYEQIAAWNPDMVLCMDINFPLDVIEKLETLTQHLFVFDHHSQTAGIDRPGVQDTRYPGCTMLVSDYLSQPLSLTSVLGMVGDQEDRLVEYPEYYAMVEQVMSDTSLSFDDIQRMTKLIDTCYIVGSTQSLHHAIDVIRADARNALTDEQFLQQEKDIETVFDQETSKQLELIDDSLAFVAIDSKYNLISEVTRAYAKANPDSVILSQQAYGELASFYVRRRNANIDLGVVVDEARSRGWNAGGKPEVAGIVMPADQLAAWKPEVIALLQKHLAD